MWIFFSLLAAFFWASTNTVDKYLMSKRNLNPFFVLFILCSFDFIFGLGFFLFFSKDLAVQHLYGFLLGLLIPLTDFLYLKSIKQEEVSRVIPWFELSTLLVAVGGAIFLGELLQLKQYLGIIILLLSLWLLTIKDRFAVQFDRWVMLMIINSFIYAFSLLMQKYLLSEINPFSLFGVMGLGSLFGFLPFLFWKWTEIKTGLKLNLNSIKIIFLSEVSGLSAICFTILALNIGLATLVSVFSSLQYLILFIMTTLFTILMPSIIKEDINKKFLLLKLIAIIMVIIGVYLVTA